MKKLSLILIITVFVFSTFPISASAEKNGSINLKSIAEIEVETFNEEGMKTTKRVPATKVIPGTEVIFTTLYTNIGKEDAEKAEIINPVPEHMIFKDGSVTGDGANISFSVDNGKSYDLPKNLMIIAKEGEKVGAGPEDYTHIKWTFIKPIVPSAKGDVSFRAILK